MTDPRRFTIEEERGAFEKLLAELMKEHEGEFVVFHHGEPVEFFGDHSTAYEYALDRFGLDDVFLIAEVEPPSSVPISIAWSAGVMFG